MSYVGPAILTTSLQKIDIDIALATDEEPLPNGGVIRSWTAEFTTTASPVPLAGECAIVLPDGRQGRAVITGWQADSGSAHVGLLSGQGPLSAHPEHREEWRPAQ
ncbi:hypothetical protein ACIBKY_52120 [Nonomuraea sp. NPDC050394]|uniref:hypothetical protein n=1 Tax=Nonomuraea sp. NPDC050394 TaxID=3364363 RepID=UPI0037BD34F1